MGPPIVYLSGPDDHSLWAPDEQAKGYLHLGWSSTTSQSFHYNGRMFSTPLAAVPLSGTEAPAGPTLDARRAAVRARGCAVPPPGTPPGRRLVHAARPPIVAPWPQLPPLERIPAGDQRGPNGRELFLLRSFWPENWPAHFLTFCVDGPRMPEITPVFPEVDLFLQKLWTIFRPVLGHFYCEFSLNVLGWEINLSALWDRPANNQPDQPRERPAGVVRRRRAAKPERGARGHSAELVLAESADPRCAHD